MPTTSALALCATAWLMLSAGAQAAELVVARQGKSTYQIAIPSAKTEAIEYAASELQGLLHDVSGATLPVVTEERGQRAPAFLIGPSKRAAKAGLIERAQKLGDDGVLIKTVGRDLVLLGGGDRGQLYSVYLLLERWLGCRFLATDCTLTPHRDVVALPQIDYSYTPQFTYREELYYDVSKGSPRLA